MFRIYSATNWITFVFYVLTTVILVSSQASARTFSKWECEIMGGKVEPIVGDYWTCTIYNVILHCEGDDWNSECTCEGKAGDCGTWPPFVLVRPPEIIDRNMLAGDREYIKGDLKSALEKMRPRAEAGDAVAMYLMATIYKRGDGVMQDYVLSHMWYNLSAFHGLREATGARENLAATMTKEDVALAHSLARDWVDLQHYKANAKQGSPGKVNKNKIEKEKERGKPK